MPSTAAASNTARTGILAVTSAISATFVVSTGGMVLASVAIRAHAKPHCEIAVPSGPDHRTPTFTVSSIGESTVIAKISAAIAKAAIRVLMSGKLTCESVQKAKSAAH